MLSSRRVTENKYSPQSGEYNVTLEYRFSSGQRRYIHVRTNSEEEAQIILNKRKDEVTHSLIMSNAREAFSLGITTAYKEASEQDVKYMYLLQGSKEPEPYEAYKIMSKVADDILSMGIPLEQMAQLFGVDIQVAQSIMDKWQVLKQNEQAILDYIAIGEV